MANRGIQANLNLERYQRSILVGLVLITLGIVATVMLENADFSRKLPPLLPVFLKLYLQAYFTNVLLGSCCLIMGLLIFLERPGWLFPQRLGSLLVALIAIALPFSILLHYSLPISATMLDRPMVIEGIVLQTTDFTCAPASIATLMRYSGRDPNFSEKEALALTKTTRWGTTTITEINVLRKLGFQPEYQTGLTIEDLVQRQQLAILHVDEPVQNGTIPHAVVLLSIQDNQQQVTIANPLYGKEIKTYSEMDDYWRKEAIFIEK
ncbi:MAG: cysteine peptidase family C39 domain-containing protein [Microcoleaceae cyanobacterium MO_207.B10]|nr:cysteine peptidase family C39 domain-containing protein [Microcoleaceae cyanobacterium MO_207.B10]